MGVLERAVFAQREPPPVKARAQGDELGEEVADNTSTLSYLGHSHSCCLMCRCIVIRAGLHQPCHTDQTPAEAHTQTHAHTHTHTHTHTQTHTQRHMHTHALVTHPHQHTQIHVGSHQLCHTQHESLLQRLAETLTKKHTHTHTHSHTNKQTHVGESSPKNN